MPGFLNAFGSKSDREQTKATRLENKAKSKEEKETARLNEQKEKADRKAEKINEYKDRAATAKANQKTELAKEKEERENEKNASVLDGLSLAAVPGQTSEQIAKCYSNVVDDLLNLNDEDGNEQGLEKGEGKLVAIIKDRIEQNKTLNNATSEQLKNLLKAVEAKQLELRKKFTDTYAKDASVSLSDIKKIDRKCNRLKEHIKHRIIITGA